MRGSPQELRFTMKELSDMTQADAHSTHAGGADRADAPRETLTVHGADYATTHEPVDPTRRFDTSAVRAGYRPDSLYGSVNVPIYASSTYAQDGVNKLRGGFEYARVANPTSASLEGVIAELEKGRFGRAFSSGMSATDILLRALLAPGTHIVLPNDVYGGTFRLVETVFGKWGVDYSVADITDAESVRAAIRPNTTCVWIETPTNPLLTVADIRAIADVVAETNEGFASEKLADGVAPARLVVDNTFATPYLQRPLELGADVVLHSTTKYIGGHSDVIGGALVTNDPVLDDELDFLRMSIGVGTGPFDAYLAVRGIKTLGVRMERHCDNAEKVAEFLESRPEVVQVLYPGLESHPGHEVAKRQMKRFGGMVGARLAGGAEAARKLCELTEEFLLAESLGGVESLIELPASMTHQSTEGTQLEIPADMVRISVGIEDIDDLLEDLAQALDRL